MIRTISKKELRLLKKYASNCKFIIETGGGGFSTKYLAKASLKNKVKMITIEFQEKKCIPIKNVEYMIGWSISYNDIIKVEDSEFIDSCRFNSSKKISKRSKDYIDGLIAHGYKKKMIGDTDLIRKSLKKYNNLELDFFFCDSGEYCGLAEWNIVKNEIKVGGYFSIHDIYYPKSIKGFKVIKKIEKSKKWKILEKTKTKQGLLIAKKIK